MHENFIYNTNTRDMLHTLTQQGKLSFLYTIYAAFLYVPPSFTICILRKKKKEVEEKCFATIGKHYFAQSMHNHRVC